MSFLVIRSIVLSVSSLCLVLQLPFRHPFCFPGSRLLSSRISYSDFETTPVIGFHISGRQEIGLKLLCCKLCCLFRIFNAHIRFEIGMPFWQLFCVIQDVIHFHCHALLETCQVLQSVTLHPFIGLSSWVLFYTSFKSTFLLLSNPIVISSVIRQKGQSQNGCFKRTKHAKFSGKGTFFTP